MYNCSTTHIDRIRAFAESFYMLLCGTGVGYSIQHRHIDKLPKLIDVEFLTYDTTIWIVPDTIEGWCDAVDIMISSFFEGNEHTGVHYEFDYSKIRPEGAPLSHGGKAPGPKGLASAIVKIREVFLSRVQSGYQKLRSLDCYDILCHLSDAVLSGGVRRSASLSLFDIDDELMLKAKTGNWSDKNPQRARSNNSVAIPRGKVSRDKFHLIIDNIKQYGEPGFIFLEHLDYCFNPCAEIQMCPTAIYKPTDKTKIQKLPDKYKHYLKRSKGFKSPLVQNYTHELIDERERFERYGFNYVSGWSVCNLTEINGKKINTKKDFKEAVWAATVIGTLQVGYTNHGYLKEESKHIIEREALLGVSITGMQDSPAITLNADIQKEMAEYAVEVNREFSARLDVNVASRVTTVKPSGNAAVLLGCASGIHPHHAKRFFRRIQVNKLDNVLTHFYETNPHMVENCCWSTNNTDDIITFPIEIENGAVVKSAVNAIEFLEMVRLTQKNWVGNGISRPESLEGGSHNVSNTVLIKDNEWDTVADYLFENQNGFSGISLLPCSGDKIYEQAPMEICFSRKSLVEQYGIANVETSEKIHDNIIHRLPTTSVQGVRDKIISMEGIYEDYLRKYKWIEKNCTPYIDENRVPTETKYEFESRCEYEYFVTLAIYRDIKTNIIGLECLNTILDLISSVKDDEKWDALVNKCKKVDYSTLVEEEDNTEISHEVACGGGACELDFIVEKAV